MSYASRYSKSHSEKPAVPQRTGAVSPSNTKRAVRSETQYGGRTSTPNRSITRTVPEHLNTPSKRNPLRPKSPSASEGLVVAVHQKLRGFTELRELMEALAERHKKEEVDLERLMKRVLSAETPAAAIPSKSDTLSLQQLQLQLLHVTEERDKALQMLHLFRNEGSAVMQRMHQSLMHAQEQHADTIARVDKLSTENGRLRFIVREVRALDPAEAVSDTDDVDDTQHDSYRQRLQIAKRTIEKLDELLQEADTVIVSLRAHNEELLKLNDGLRARERKLLPSDEAVACRSEASEISATDDDMNAVVERLKQQLREEKRQRLEAEELSHKLLIEHQKNVLLLEQRLMTQRSGAPTPRGGVPTPQKPRVVAVSVDPSSSVAVPPIIAGVPRRHPNGGSPPAATLDDEIALMMCTPSTHVSPSEAREGSLPLLITTNTAPSGDDGTSELHMNELRDIEKQLQEVVASLEDS